MTYDWCVRQKNVILKHVLKCCGNRKLCHRPAVRLSRATKIVPCKSDLLKIWCHGNDQNTMKGYKVGMWH